jgi:hypothetical protein
VTFRVYSINVRWEKTPFNLAALEAALAASMAGGDWVRLNGFTYLIWTGLSAEALSRVVRTVLKEPEDIVLIYSVDLSDFSGWAPKWMWDWLLAKRSQGADAGGLLQPQQNRLTGL